MHFEGSVNINKIKTFHINQEAMLNFHFIPQNMQRSGVDTPINTCEKYII